jgi:hypothetical protein
VVVDFTRDSDHIPEAFGVYDARGAQQQLARLATTARRAIVVAAEEEICSQSNQASAPPFVLAHSSVTTEGLDQMKGAGHVHYHQRPLAPLSRNR